MSSHPQNKKKFATITVLLFFIILFAINYKTGGAISNSLRSLAAPVWSIKDETLLGLQNFKSTFASKRRLASELESLHKELSALRDLEYENLYLRAQNNTLLSLSNTLSPISKQSNRIVAQVYSGVGVHPYGTILIRIKENDNIQVGAIVLTQYSVALGTVSSVSSRVAIVRLFSAAERAVDVVVGDNPENPVVATAFGVGNGNFIISVPRDTSVQVGDVVYSRAALGYPIAIVGSVEQDPTNPFTTIRARAPINIQALQTVLVD